MDTKTERKIVKPWQALVMMVVAIGIIILGVMVVKCNNAITLLVDGVVMCVLACLFGIKYDDLQAGIKNTITSMIVAILILIAVGVLVGTWMISGTVPYMIYLGMKVLTPGLFLPIVCILCTLMSTMAGTSWGTVATVGVACMGVATGLGVPLAPTAGAVVVGAIFGDKISPLSDSTVLTATISDTSLMTGVKHALISTGPAYVISLIFFFVYGMQFGGGTVGGESYDLILGTVSDTFNLNPLLLLPPVTVLVLIILKKPTLPTFTAGIVVAIVLALVFQGVSVKDVAGAMYAGFTGETGVEIVDKMLRRGGMSSMLGTIGLLLAAGVFGAPLRTAGIVDILLDFVKKFAKNSRIMATFTMLLHGLFFTITGAYYVSYPVIGSMVKDMYPEYGLDKKNLMRNMLDTGTGLAPLVPWATTGVYIATTLGVSNMEFAPFAPMLWLSIVFSLIINVTGFGLAKLKPEAAPAAEAAS
ncbi:Na+/H+ antiporter NhaC [Ruminococcaceae bacterium OttesenSCG-928-A11]|nr:Na+/H+ antiporter NhaC [Ruminococcaceae bacterium OttesenSCG-928-A11]